MDLSGIKITGRLKEAKKHRLLRKHRLFLRIFFRGRIVILFVLVLSFVC